MKPAIVVPCYNEAERLDFAQFVTLLDGGAQLIFVNDGSTDATQALIETFAAEHEDVLTLSLPQNCGKAETVRHGLKQALRLGCEVVCYLDADLATPPNEMLRVLREIDRADVVLGSRVALLGRNIQRSAHRHLLGRVFATAASVALGLRVYDTQCGAKVFRVTPSFEAALAKPFSANWAFDVELLSRLLAPPDGTAPLEQSRIVEVPLYEWHDVKGSKLRFKHMAWAGYDIMRMSLKRALR